MPREKDIVISGWKEGVAPSPLVGYNMRNVDIDAISGAVQSNFRLETADNVAEMNTYTATTFTADDTTDVCTIPASEFYLSGTPCELTTTNTLPAGLATSTTYYIKSIDSTTFKFYPTYDDARDDTNEVDITDTGTGTHTLTPINVGLIVSMTQNSDGTQKFASDNNKQVWRTYTSDTKPWEWLGEVDGFVPYMVWWKDYLLVTQADEVDALDYSTLTWTRSIMDAALESSSAPHYMMIGPDDKVYIANGRYLAYIQETDGDVFDPTDGASFAAPAKALDLPQDEEIRSITALGVDLMLGTTSSKIYRWDRVSDTYYNPLEVEAGQIDALITMNNLVYVFPSSSNKLYVTDGTNINTIAEIPKYLTGETPVTNTPRYNQAGIFIDDGKIFFHVTGNSLPSVGYAGMWSLTPEGVLNYEKENSIGETGGENVITGAANQDYVSYSFNSVDYIDAVSSTTRYSNWEAFIESPLIRIGTASQRKTLRQFDVYLAEGLQSNCGVRLKVRDDIYATWTLIGTIDEDTNGEIQKYTFDYLYEGENIQIRAELDGANGTTPMLIEIRAR